MDMVPLFQKSYDFYKNLYTNLRHIPKRDRYTWGERCEMLAIDLLKIMARVQYLTGQEKRSALVAASNLVDQLKIFLRLGSDLKILLDKHSLPRQKELQEIGKMLGSWMKQVR